MQPEENTKREERSRAPSVSASRCCRRAFRKARTLGELLQRNTCKGKGVVTSAVKAQVFLNLEDPLHSGWGQEGVIPDRLRAGLAFRGLLHCGYA